MTNSIVGIVLLMLRFVLGCDISVDLGHVLLSIDFRNDFKQHCGLCTYVISTAHAAKPKLNYLMCTSFNCDTRTVPSSCRAIATMILIQKTINSTGLHWEVLGAMCNQCVKSLCQYLPTFKILL